MENNEGKFEFTYIAPTERERREVEALRKEYLPKEESVDKMTRLRALNKRAQTPPKVLALTLGVVGTLIFGTGLTMILEWGMLLWGVAFAVVGILPVVIAYPLYKWWVKKRKDRCREEILKLSEEILNEEKGA